jgi:hypothetical protein
MFYRIILYFGVVLGCSVVVAALTPQLVCPNAHLQKKFNASQSGVVPEPSKSVSQISRSVAAINTVRSFRVDEGFRNLNMILRYQAPSLVVGGPLVNIWVEQFKYEDQLNDNNLNSTTHLSGVQPTRITDRDSVIQEMGDLLVTLIVPAVISAFGPINPVISSPSDGLNVFVYDISDNFSNSGEFVGGYFDPDDKFNGFNNKVNAIHMDLFPSNPGGNPTALSFGISALPRKDFYHVLAHELQHLIHSQFDNNETIWVNEGFSQFAIYRVFHQTRFLNGDIILNTPSDAPSQVSFWLQNPESSLLMSSDEPGITGDVFQRFDSAELRGIGYLFFCYLWEQLGGVAQGDFLVPGAADQAFRSMIQSAQRGIATFSPGLSGRGTNFNEAFSSFPVALALDGGSPLTTLGFFDSHGSLQLNIGLNQTGFVSDPSQAGNSGQVVSSLSYPLSGYEFRYVKIMGDSSTAASLRLTSASPVTISVLTTESSVRALNQNLTTSTHLVFLPKDSEIILVLNNPSHSSLSVQLSAENPISLDPVVVPQKTVSDSGLDLSPEIGPFTLNANSIKRQVLENQTNRTLDLLNNQPNEVDIRVCLFNQNCINASHQVIPAMAKWRRSRKSKLSINNEDFYFTNLQLLPQTKYDLYYANKTAGSLNFSPRLTQAVALTSLGSASTPFIPVASNGGSISTGECFLASAAFLGSDSFEVDVLSRFRDEILLKTSWGRGFVDLYYQFSPPLATEIERSPLLSWLLQILLSPLLILAGILGATTPLVFFLLGFCLVGKPRIT